MKPLGTITQHFPLVQANIRQTLECILKQSSDKHSLQGIRFFPIGLASSSLLCGVSRSEKAL